MGQIRITGGTHRSRKINVVDQPGLRPTADRIRETLFNWLGQNLTGLEVLDLYAGSGILALEAASRNAAGVDCVDHNPKVIKQLRQNIESLQLPNIQVYQQMALGFLRNNEKMYDLMFLDPPFESDEMHAISGIIADKLRPSGRVYREFRADQEVAPLDDGHWTLNKHKKAGQVCFELWHKK